VLSIVTAKGNTLVRFACSFVLCMIMASITLHVSIKAFKKIIFMKTLSSLSYFNNNKTQNIIILDLLKNYF
jgi:hypothetical protein